MTRGWGLLAALTLASVLAIYWPSIGSASFDPLTMSRPLLPWLIAVTMLSLGSLLPRDEVRALRLRWPLTLVGLLAQCLVMPIAAWSVATMLSLDEATRIGFILVGCVPGAMASNVLTLAARGNVSYSIALTVCATLAAPITIPLLLQSFLGETSAGVWNQIHPATFAGQLAMTIAFPVMVGFGLSSAWQAWHRMAQKIGPWVAECVILWIIAVVVAVNRDAILEVSSLVVAGLFLVNIVGYLGGYVVGWCFRMDVPMRRALTLEVGMQNAGLGSVLALSLFPEYPGAAIPTAGYTFGCMLTGTLLAAYWQWTTHSQSPLRNREVVADFDAAESTSDGVSA